MLRLVPKLACGLAMTLLVTSGCEEKKKGMEQQSQEAAADYGLDYLEPDTTETAYESTPAYDSYAAKGTGSDLTAGGTGVASTTSAGGRVHIVQPKETLSSIAYKYYGTRNWRKIYEANRERIADPNVIHPGMKLIIP